MDGAHVGAEVHLRAGRDGGPRQQRLQQHPDAQGRGLATEAAGGALAHGFAHGVYRIWAIMLPHNEASARVAAAIGLRDLGARSDPGTAHGTPENPESPMFLVRSRFVAGARAAPAGATRACAVGVGSHQ